MNTPTAPPREHGTAIQHDQKRAELHAPSTHAYSTPHASQNQHVCRDVPRCRPSGSPQPVGEVDPSTGSSSKCINASSRAAAADRRAGAGGRCVVTAQRPPVSCRERSSLCHSSRCLTSIQNAVGTATYSRPPLTRSRHIQNCQPSSSLPLMATASHSGEHSRCSTRMLRHETSRISTLTHSDAHSMS